MEVILEVKSYLFVKYDGIHEKKQVVGSFCGIPADVSKHLDSYYSYPVSVYERSFVFIPLKQQLIEILSRDDNPYKKEFLEFLSLDEKTNDK
jgi:hypothetical protein